MITGLGSIMGLFMLLTQKSYFGYVHVADVRVCSRYLSQRLVTLCLFHDIQGYFGESVIVGIGVVGVFYVADEK